MKNLHITDSGTMSSWCCPECSTYNKRTKRYHQGDHISCMSCKTKIALNDIVTSETVYEIFKVTE